MSRSSNIVENPCTKFLDWDSESAKFKYWDKSKGEKGENVFIELPFRFIVLDELSTIKGFSEKDESGIWSNEVKTKDSILTVRTNKGVLVSGTYDNIKDAVSAVGGKYTKSIYIAVGTEIWNLQLKGAAFSGWLEFQKKVGRNKIYKDAVVCDNFRPEKKGRVNYTIPEFSIEAISEEENNHAKNLDASLQEYLKYYLNKAEPAKEEVDTGYAD